MYCLTEYPKDMALENTNSKFQRIIGKRKSQIWRLLTAYNTISLNAPRTKNANVGLYYIEKVKQPRCFTQLEKIAKFT